MPHTIQMQSIMYGAVVNEPGIPGTSKSTRKNKENIVPSTVSIAKSSLRRISPSRLSCMNALAQVYPYAWLDQVEQTASCPMDKLSEDTLLQRLLAENRLRSIHSSEPTLNDIFLELTGRTLV